MSRVLGWFDVLAYPVFAAFVVAVGPRDAYWYAGLILSAAFAMPWLFARWQLGTSFSATAQARKLITEGIYSKIRHPIYVFGTPAYLCLVLALIGPKALVIWLCVGVVQLLRASREDRVLAEAFGAEYVAYRKRTWF